MRGTNISASGSVTFANAWPAFASRCVFSTLSVFRFTTVSTQYIAFPTPWPGATSLSCSTTYARSPTQTNSASWAPFTCGADTRTSRASTSSAAALGFQPVGRSVATSAARTGPMDASSRAAMRERMRCTGVGLFMENGSISGEYLVGGSHECTAIPRTTFAQGLGPCGSLGLATGRNIGLNNFSVCACGNRYLDGEDAGVDTVGDGLRFFVLRKMSTKGRA